MTNRYTITGTGSSGYGVRVCIKAADHADAMRAAKARKITVESCTIVSNRLEDQRAARNAYAELTRGADGL